MISGLVTTEPGDRLLFAILAASAPYIVVPAAMKLAAPKADPSMYIPMAMAFNITLGIPIYHWVIMMS